MLNYIVRRVLYMIPILLGVTLITFLLFNVVGGNPAIQYAGKHATAENIKLIERELGLDRPLPEQYLLFLKQVVTFDFGRSWASRQEITTMLMDGVGPSITLTAPAFLIQIILAISLALLLAHFRGTWLDKTAMVICLGLVSVSFLVYIIFFQYFFGYYLGWFPISGYDSDWIGRWQYVLLPTIILVTVGTGGGVLLYRTIMLDEIFQDYVRTARAKGLGLKKVYFKHVLKNAMIPIITIVVIEIPSLLTGSLLLENFFGIPGLGSMLVKALYSSDFPVIKAMTFLGTLLYMIFNLLSDICYALVDPRVQLK
jgi:peptide/nickel transport system permease protein